MVQQQQHWYKEKKRRREKRLERSYRRKMVRRDIFFHFLRGVYTHTHTRPHIKRGEKRKKRLSKETQRRKEKEEITNKSKLKKC